MSLFSHQIDRHGRWQSAKGDRFTIFDINDYESTHRTRTFNKSAHGASAVQHNPFVEAESEFAYAQAMGFTMVGVSGTAADILVSPRYSLIDRTDNVQGTLYDISKRLGGYPAFLISPSANGAVLDPFDALVFVDTISPVGFPPFGFKLPANPVQGQSVRIIDHKGSFGDNPVLLDGNGYAIDGDPNRVLDTPYGVYEMYFDGSRWTVQEEDPDQEMHEMPWSTATWTDPLYAGKIAVRKQLWSGKLLYYVRMQGYVPGAVDGILHEVDAGTGFAPNFNPTAGAIRTFTKSQVDGVITVI